MRILLQGRSTRSIETTPGGDQVQIEETARFLRERFKIDVTLSSELEPDLAEIDAVHLFGIVRPQEVWVQAQNARRQGKPVLLSTVYCDVREFEKTARTGPVGWVARRTNSDVFEALKTAGRALNNREWSKGSAALFARGFTRMQREIIEMSSMFLPNSWSEWHRLTSDLELTVSDERVATVPNGVDLSDLNMDRVDPTELARLAGFQNAILCVARVEGRKNQLRLIEALSNTDFTLVLAGKPTPNQTRYVAKVRDAAARARNVHYLGEVSPDTKRALYSLARVHVLPSWMETTGISSLEAAVMDCSLVVTPNGDTREYFCDWVDYCDPSDLSSIRAAIEQAYARTPSRELAETIRADYTWANAAEATYAAYRKVLG
jgi:glycosyltransferase involved in cell wall biosynthesis